MRALVTGAGGMLGRALCRRLERDHTVIPATREWFDITDETSTRKALVAERPAVVIHAAAFTRVDDAEAQRETAFAVNALGTRHVALGCREAGAWLVYLSTDYVFDGGKRTPYVETDPTAPLSVYGASKLEGEREISLLGLPCLIVRTSWLFGPGGNNFVRAIYAKAKEGSASGGLRVVDDQEGSPTYTGDLAEAIARLIRLRMRGVVHAANAGHCTWFQFAQAIVEEAGLQGVSLTPISTRELNPPRQAPRPPYSVLSTTRYRALTGAGLPPWREALREYLRLEGWLGERGEKSEVRNQKS